MPTYLLLILMTLACLIYGDAFARPPAGPPPIDLMIAELGLDETQAMEFRAIMEVHHETMRSLRESSEHQAERRAVRQQTDSALQAILTEEQFSQLRSNRRDGRNGARHNNRRGNGDNARRPADDQRSRGES
ncbi:MAG: hypothetical protein AAGJ52_04190 [Pseudomonadota bacterium]